MNKLSRLLNLRAARTVAAEIEERNIISKVIAKSRYPIPVIIVGFNNGAYLKNMVLQLTQRGIYPLIIDNKSTDIGTIKVLKEVEKESAEVVRASRNLSHLVGFLDPIYKLLPDVFAYTDPDLQFNNELPDNFIIQLAEVADLYECYKAGMALDIYNSGEIRNVSSTTIRKHPFNFSKTHDIVDWENQFWKMPLKHNCLEVYAASIDTTFAVYQKKYYNGQFEKAVRVAGKFTAIHMPWFKDLDIFSAEDRRNYAQTAKHSMWIKSE